MFVSAGVIAELADPGLPPLSWRITRRSRPVFLPAMRVVQCTFDYFNRTRSLPPSVF